MQSPESPWNSWTSTTGWATEGRQGLGGPKGSQGRMKGPVKWPLSFSVPSLPSNCPQAEDCFVQGNRAGLTLPLASALDPSSKGRPLRPTRPVSTSKGPEPAMSWWSTAHAALHAGIVWFSLTVKTAIMRHSQTSLLFTLNCSIWLLVWYSRFFLKNPRAVFSRFPFPYLN